MKVGILWTLLERFSSLFCQLITLIVLARFLSPDDFAIVGITTFFISISQILIDSGMGGSLLLKPVVNEKDYSTLFIYNVVIGFIIYLLLFFLSPLIADFYSNIELIAIIRVVSIGLLITTFGKIQNVILYKELKFKEISRISIFSTLLSSFFSIVLAYNGYGYWSLIYQSLVFNLLVVLFQFSVCRYFPRLFFSKISFLEQWNFGKGLLFSKIINSVYSNLLLLLFPKISSLNFSGCYSQASRIYNIPISVANSLLQGVVFPVFSKEENVNILILKFRQNARFFYLSALVFFIFLGIFSKSFVLIVLGEKWISVHIILSFLCVLGIQNVIVLLYKNLLKVLNKTLEIFYFDIFNSLLGIFFIFLMFKFGDYFILGGLICANFIALLFFMKNVSKILNLNYKILFKDLSSIIYVVIFPSLLLMLSKFFFANNVDNIFVTLVFFVLYLILILIFGFLFKNQEIMLIMKKLRR